MSERDIILEDLAPLFERAERDGLWFHNTYRDLWFSPAELRAHHKNGNGEFVWSSIHWTLRDPRERLKEYDRQSERLKNEIQSFVDRMGV